MAYKNPQDAKDYYKKWKEKNATKVREYLREWNKRTRPYAKKRALHLKSRFGMTVEQYEIMFNSQNGKCAICLGGKKINRALSIDHNHTTGKIRGLLCDRCNFGLGAFTDSIELLNKAKQYIKKHEKQRI